MPLLQFLSMPASAHAIQKYLCCFNIFIERKMPSEGTYSLRFLNRRIIHRFFRMVFYVLFLQAIRFSHLQTLKNPE
jgi:hypothetical protein